MSETSAHCFRFTGIDVQFPFKPYPSQIAIMNKVVRGIKYGENCIIESPTGTGKTLALLCSALSVQEQWMHEVRDRGDDNDDFQENISASPVQSPPRKSLVKVSTTTPSKDNNNTPVTIHYDHSDDAFQTPKRFKSAEVRKLQKTPDTGSSVDSAVYMQKLRKDDRDKFVPTRRITKLYYGTRTHRQITQVIRELERTRHRPRLAILASRNQLCTNGSIRKKAGKGDLNEKCAEALDLSRCSYFEKAKAVSSSKQLLYSGNDASENFAVFDIEDLVDVGKRVRGCSYYASRSMAGRADIVFCPYNYLVDPAMREAMDIQLNDETVVIIDEAHNIEDSARNAASIEMTDLQISDTLNQLLAAQEKEVNPIINEISNTILLVETLQQLFQADSRRVKRDGFRSLTRLWDGKEFGEIMKTAAINADTLEILERSFATLVEERKQEEPTERLLPMNIVHNVRGLLRVFYRILRDGEGDKDYQIAVEENKGMPDHIKWKFRCTILCLNPGVSFKPIADLCRAVVLASGTLAPLSSFESELCSSFPHRIEASHVIPQANMWAGLCDLSPLTGIPLRGTFKESETIQYQDAIGELVYRVCKRTPNGVLCFIPSYGALERLIDRWEVTGTMAKISELKSFHVEPKDVAQFEATIQEYYSNCASRGALLLGVYRGKISEGIDFAHHYARAVITVGIPFPNLMGTEVSLKRTFNDAGVKRGLLSGNMWYECQAFRAYNQALGRCIRSRSDWGALIMVDCRLRNERMRNMISTWIRKEIRTFGRFQDFEHSLDDFMCVRMQKEVLAAGADDHQKVG